MTNKEWMATGNARRSHNGSKHPEYFVWSSLRRRCQQPSDPAYPNYGGRGISVCERWNSSYANFIGDLGRRPSDRHTIDRFPNNNGNYEPGNVRWALRDEQNRNRRSNIWIDFRGKRQILKDWCGELGINYGTAKQRISRSGMSPLEAITRPVEKKGELNAF